MADQQPTIQGVQVTPRNMNPDTFVDYIPSPEYVERKIALTKEYQERMA